jgi:subtilisin family serine protease
MELESLVKNHAAELKFVERDLPIKVPELRNASAVLHAQGRGRRGKPGKGGGSPSPPSSDNDDDSDFSCIDEDASGNLWALDRIDDRKGCDGTYKPSLDGKGVHVYVLDTGIRGTHEEFGAKRFGTIPGRAIPTLDTSRGILEVCSPKNWSCAADGLGHGTHVAGTVGGKKSGVAKGVLLHAVKVLPDKGFGKTSWIVKAVDWVTRNAVKPAIMWSHVDEPWCVRCSV